MVPPPESVEAQRWRWRKTATTWSLISAAARRRQDYGSDAEAAGARTLLYRCDVSDDSCVRAMIAATEKEFGRLDVLINNAGTTVDVEPKNLEGMKVEDWNRVFNVNVLGLFLVTRAAVPP